MVTMGMELSQRADGYALDAASTTAEGRIIMRLVIEKCICDICKKEVERITTVNYPVIFHTEQTEGRSCSPYISKEKLDLCDECAERVLMLDGWGAQGVNSYDIRKQQKEGE